MKRFAFHRSAVRRSAVHRSAIRRSVLHRSFLPTAVLLMAAVVLAASVAKAQTAAPRHDVPSSQPMQGMASRPGMSMPRTPPRTFIQEIERHATSGTSAEPNSTPMPMLMTMRGPWMLMFHANAFITEEQQTSPRGGDKLFSTNWFMPMAQRRLGPGLLTLRAMFSLEPATVTGERYPLLFQQGETAYGVPIADGQHPHNFFMEVAAIYDWRLSKHSLFTLYVAPVGGPALGPIAYPHRASALENPVGALGHHQEDSTHISDDVITGAFTYKIVRLEASGFHGREPDEFRWDIDQGAVDSWSTRLTVQPGQNWSGQFSYGRLTSPESLSPSVDQARTTASIQYNRPWHRGNLASTLVWGHTRSIPDNGKLNSYLFEATAQFLSHNYVWTRIENAGRTNELLIGENPLPPGFVEMPLTHVQAYTLGYDRDIRLVPHVSSALGAQFTLYGVGAPLQPIYGSDPVSYNVFLRFRPR